MAARRCFAVGITLALLCAGLPTASAPALAVVTPPPNILLNNPAGYPATGSHANPAIASIGNKVVGVWQNNVGTTNESEIIYNGGGPGLITYSEAFSMSAGGWAS